MSSLIKITEAYQVSRITSRFCVPNKFDVHREQFPVIVAYAITIHKGQPIIDLSDKLFGEGMAYVALSRIRSLNGVHLTSFTSDAIMASRACVKECNRLREQFRLDLALYQLPSKRSVKRRMTGAITHPAKRPCTGKCSTPKRKHDTEEQNEQSDQSSCDDCFIVD